MFGQKLQQMRAQAELSQSELAARVGVAVGTIQDWETGGGEPGSGAIAKLAQALGVPAEELNAGLKESREIRENQVIAAPRVRPDQMK